MWLLYFGGLEPNPKYLRGLPVSCLSHDQVQTKENAEVAQSQGELEPSESLVAVVQGPSFWLTIPLPQGLQEFLLSVLMQR